MESSRSRSAVVMMPKQNTYLRRPLRPFQFAFRVARTLVVLDRDLAILLCTHCVYNKTNRLPRDVLFTNVERATDRLARSFVQKLRWRRLNRHFARTPERVDSATGK